MPIGVYKRTKTPPILRFKTKYRVLASGCWEWVGARNRDGYGDFWNGETNVPAHRWSYEHYVGIIPHKLVIDHLCRFPACVNPKHLECVTMLVNTERGVLYETLTMNAVNKTHCKRGHPLFGENLGRDGRGDRYCRCCMAMKVREWAARNRERINELQRIRRGR